MWTVDQWQIERLWLFPRGFDSRRSNQVLQGVRLVASRWSLKPATDVRFVHSLPRRDRSAARISGSDPEDSGSNPLPAAKQFHAGVVQLDQDTRLRTERLEGSNPSARTISAPRPRDQGTALRRLESAFESPGADQRGADRCAVQDTRVCRVETRLDASRCRKHVAEFRAM